ncbi:MAG: hypothetical protein U0935_05055 [Pirellulales bacterium]
MRFPGSTRTRFTAILILGTLLLAVDAVRRWEPPVEQVGQDEVVGQDERIARNAFGGAPSVLAEKDPRPPTTTPSAASEPHTNTAGTTGGGDPAAGWAPRGPEPLVIEVLGSDFRWHYRWPGGDGQLGTADDRESVGELHVPQHVPIRLLVRSRDYVYVYSVPGLALRRIAVPELTYSLDFLATAPACYQVVVDPLCRVRPWHDEDLGQVIVDAPEDYERWWASLPQRGPTNAR